MGKGGSNSQGSRRRIGREERRRQLIHAAEESYADNGFKSPTIDQIARRAGVDRALIYQHFGSRKGLYEACVSDALDQLIERIGQSWTELQALDEQDATRLGLSIYFELVESRPAAWTLIFESGLASGSTDDAPRLIEWVAGMLEQRGSDLSRAEIEVIAVSMLSATWGVSRWWHRGQTVSRDEVVELQAAIYGRLLSPLIDKEVPK